MRIHLLQRSSPLSWALMPPAAERIRRFCEEVGTDLPAAVVPDFIEAFTVHFVTPDPQMLLFVWIEGEELVGHMLLNIVRTKWGETHANVLQFRLDRPLPRADFDREAARILPDIFAWAQRHGASEFRALARSDSVARLLKQRFGMERRGTVMRANLPEDEQGGPTWARETPARPPRLTMRLVYETPSSLPRLTTHLPVASPGPPPLTVHHLGTQGPPEEGSL